VNWPNFTVTNPLLKGKTYEKARSKTQIAYKTIHDLTVSFSESRT
jgi:hypothetical protein